MTDSMSGCTHPDCYTALDPVADMSQDCFVDMLRRTLSDTEKILVYERYDRGDLSEEAARVLLGDEIDQIHEDTEAFALATEVDPDQFFVD